MNRHILFGTPSLCIEERTRWFRNLSLEERMRIIAETTDFLVSIYPQLMDHGDILPSRPGTQVLKRRASDSAKS